MHILTLSTLFPNAIQPLNALFVQARMEAFTRRYRHDWTVVAPIPYFPKLPFPTIRTYDDFARVPGYESQWGYPVHHPRYLVVPRFGMRYYGAWMTAGVRKTVAEIHRKRKIDIIDGHYVYPDGTAAVQMGRELGIPVVLSARGTDLNLYPRFPAIARRIRGNLRDCSRLICVCSELKEVALGLGIPGEKVTVIGNGVDVQRFKPGDKLQARQKLGLPTDATIILSVGHMTERKGFHILLDACAGMSNPNLLLVLAGGGPMRPALERQAKSCGLGEHARFPGPLANSELPAWYQAADFFALASSREGWPNVLCEAQACGLPCIATKSWGMPEIIYDGFLGILVADRSARGFREAMESALATPWNRERIASVGQSRSWDGVSESLDRVFEAAARR